MWNIFKECHFSENVILGNYAQDKKAFQYFYLKFSIRRVNGKLYKENLNFHHFLLKKYLFQRVILENFECIFLYR